MNLPSSWKEISIGQYIELRPFIEMKADTPFKQIDKVIAQLVILTGKPIDEVKKINASEIRGIQEELQWMLALPKLEIPEKFKVGDKHFRPTLYKHDISAGQFMSITELLKDSQENPELTWQNLHYILVNVCYEVDKKGNKIEIENESQWVKETAELFYKEFPFSLAYPIAVFFCEVSKRLPAIIQDYSINQAETILKEVRADLEQDGAGISL